MASNAAALLLLRKNRILLIAMLVMNTSFAMSGSAPWVSALDWLAILMCHQHVERYESIGKRGKLV